MAGYKRLTASGTVDGTHAIVLYGFSSTDSGVTGSVAIYDGQDNSGVKLFDELSDQVYDFGTGVVLPSGCYVTLGGTVTSATIYYERLG